MTVQGNLPAGPVLTRGAAAKWPQAAGRYLVQTHQPVWFRDFEIIAELDVVTGIYLITDPDGRIRWLGQASRDTDLVGRLAEHHANLAKRRVFSQVRVLHLQDHTPVPALNAIEGTCADWLRLRGTMPPRVWPSSAGWLALVT